MNILFRNIRENVSLDYIEESEDEDEFQDINPGKYLIDGAEHKMNCYFSKGCNRWVPESIACDDAQISVAPSVKQYPSHTNKPKNRSSPRWKSHHNDSAVNNGNYVPSPTRRPVYNPNLEGAEGPGRQVRTPRQNTYIRNSSIQTRSYQNSKSYSRPTNQRAYANPMHF